MMAEKLGMSTGKGFVAGIYDNYAKNSTDAETAKQLLDGWTYEGEWWTGDDKNVGWLDYKGAYAVKLIDTEENKNRVYSFIINPNGAGDGSANVTRSNAVVFNRKITDTEDEISLAWLECTYTDVLKLHFARHRIVDTDSLAGSTTFKVYWKKIF
jgi:hypothetical protein